MKLTGLALKRRVLASMRARGVHEDRLSRACRVRFPADPVRCMLGESKKVNLNRARGLLTRVLHLAPAAASVPYGGRNLCRNSVPGCRAACWGRRGRFSPGSDAENAQLWRSLLWLYCPDAFKLCLSCSVERHAQSAYRAGLTAGVRLNGTSDIPWEREFPELFAEFRNVQFYDYTKRPERFASLPLNYDLTFSFSGSNWRECLRLLQADRARVAVVFEHAHSVIRCGEWQGWPVVPGDESDMRPDDPTGVIVALAPKAHARDDTGFFVKALKPFPHRSEETC